jgi:hypothetical protein
MIHYLPPPTGALAPYARVSSSDDPDQSQPNIRVDWLPVLAIIVTDEGMPDPRGPFAVRTFAMVQKHPAADDEYGYNWSAAREWCTLSSPPEIRESAARAAVANSIVADVELDFSTDDAQQHLMSFAPMIFDEVVWRDED